MPTITKIVEQKRSPNRRSIYLDGAFAFGCNLNVVAKFRLTEGQQLTLEQVKKIEQGELRQECFDATMRYLERRLHSAAELRRKLQPRQYPAALVDEVLADLARLGYLDDAKFAQSKAQSAAAHKHHGRRRARAELLKSGVSSEVADRALNVVYDDKSETRDVARQLALKQAPRLKRFDAQTARRRLIGMLQRRGFDYDDIKPVVDEALGSGEDA
jgi:regulatory protein